MNKVLKFRVGEAPPKAGPELSSSAIVAKHTVKYRALDRETFVLIFLNAKNHVIDTEVHAIGSIDSSAVYPREVFRSAILKNAASIICVHNHPSGDPEPSPCDREITRSLVHAGALLQIKVLDHIIITPGEAYYSFGDNGIIEEFQADAVFNS